MIALRRAGYRLAYTLLRLYWFLFQPQIPGVYGLVFCNHHLLLIRNSYDSREWTFPGGRQRRSETPEEAVRREVWEEVGIRLTIIHYLGEFTGREAYRHDTLYVFAASVESRDVHINPGEILEARWFSPGSLPPLHEYAQHAWRLWQRTLPPDEESEDRGGVGKIAPR